MTDQTTTTNPKTDCITPEIFRAFMGRIMADLGKPPEPPRIVCHPIDAPFIEWIFSPGPDEHFNAVYRLWNECKRKYIIGGKLGIEKWQLRPLIAQYESKLAAL